MCGREPACWATADVAVMSAVGAKVMASCAANAEPPLSRRSRRFICVSFCSAPDPSRDASVISFSYASCILFVPTNSRLDDRGNAYMVGMRDLGALVVNHHTEDDQNLTSGTTQLRLLRVGFIKATIRTLTRGTSPPDYFVMTRLGAGASGAAAAGEMANVSHRFHPSGRWLASNSL